MKRKRSFLAVLSLTTLAFLVSGCSNESDEATYASVEELREAVVDAGFPCQKWNSREAFDGSAELLGCAEGHSLLVWDESVSEEIDPKDGDMGTVHNLRGETWNVRSGAEDALNDLAQEIGGERTLRSLEVYRGNASSAPAGR